jgi:23S rRNA pseudouridine2605 synthase
MSRRAKPAAAGSRAAGGGERIQKVLAAAGFGSRREVERWMGEGRLLVNGQVATLGHKLSPQDRVTLDGRLLRRNADTQHAQGATTHVVLYHRSPGQALDLQEATSRVANNLKLPRGTRWLAIQPMPPVDGGLEILTDDGSWAYQVTRKLSTLTSDFLLRMRGPLTDALVAEFRATTDCDGEVMTILKVEPQYGSGLNHWLKVTVRATKPAVVRHWWAARGFIVSRLIRVRLGNAELGRDLPRGHTKMGAVTLTDQ